MTKRKGKKIDDNDLDLGIKVNFHRCMIVLMWFVLAIIVFGTLLIAYNLIKQDDWDKIYFYFFMLFSGGIGYLIGHLNKSGITRK